MTGVVGAIVEAWGELRIHRLRVLLALIGVACAVAAITGVTALVSMLNQSFKEQTERQAGRSITLNVGAWPQTPDAVAPTGWDEEFERVLERYDITYASRDEWTQALFRFPDGTRTTEVRAVDADHGTINRVVPEQGRWFTDADDDALAPTLVVNQAFLEALGLADLSSHPTVQLGDRAPVTASVIGVVRNEWVDAEPSAFVLYEQLHRWIGPDGSGAQAGGSGDASAGMPAQVPSMRLWVPADQSQAIAASIERDLVAALPGWEVGVSDNNYGDQSLDGATKWVGIGVGGFALLLGGLGLVNIALVTVRYRIREIGIRRSFGATSGRVFFGVLLESVVATVVAGLVGVVLAVAIIKNVPIERMFGSGIQDMPPFPVSAALVGMAAAVGVGALAGLIPATFAVRVKVIDAIRY
ncbi:ABC transporter permease [Cellulomonas fengjieae]|uniref:ABC transporter permease n=1 Tax=Cellulomonas fengjieae TaxID=2819978 RepID=A0ABS3SD74_9CELL|nr:ABC transporter permease [Cellulomonas fengjieae]MBO3083695.1 ABC transporter permease [Cellulomonas fengjieae]MBO3101554.1 ABC transporter permease [Cellulomonas fengjieae]QVI64999.1 ABC transporter permease [Cellulomonas fengjieae]